MHTTPSSARHAHARAPSLTLPRLVLTPGRALVMLRDGRKILGTLRSFDQFANLVLEHAVERVIVGRKFSDFPLGLYVIRAENLALLGTLVSSYLPCTPPTHASSPAAGTPSHPPTRPHVRRPQEENESEEALLERVENEEILDLKAAEEEERRAKSALSAVAIGPGVDVFEQAERS